MVTRIRKFCTYSLGDSDRLSESSSRLIILSGNANPQLAKDIAAYLSVPLAKALVSRFSDGEIMVELMEHVRGKDVFIVQPTCAPTNDSLMELLILVDAVRRSSAARITTVIPYFGYSRQDRRPRSARVPISAKVVANMITVVGADRVLTVDLHADQIQGFFDLPVDNIYASPVLLGDIWKHEYPNLIVVSPDVGGVVRARAFAKQMEVDLAIIDKRRPYPNQAKVMHIIGDVKGRTCLLVDDLVDTAGTLCAAARALKQNGAAKVIAYCTHPVLSGSAVENIDKSMLDELVVTDTIPLREEAQACNKIRQLSIAEILAETVYRISVGESVSSLFVE
ncbi:ribose-phosphate pyrophosphokinase [Candidatus Nitrosoglobus terrae]|uniref:Ribose-phosphate pyrophosphokinase n=1 Tax=Candidatus Nitrosoglobus terrae TaxID=1630141 RepID=A0A1Q2SPT0_9GAMM|nr:ribose-phosphate pyrophosphokinase [Candidatus Nitrosoglobus terrae]